jgi:hypothetical protein
VVDVVHRNVIHPGDVFYFLYIKMLRADSLILTETAENISCYIASGDLASNQPFAQLEPNVRKEFKEGKKC